MLHSAAPPFSPVLPRDGTAHSTSCTPLLVSSASPTFWLPPPVPSPEVDIAAWRRGRGGGRSASGEADPGLVFVNLPRSRRGQRQPRGWHGVLGPGGGVARRGTQREAVPGRFLKQIVNFIKRIQLENQDWQTLFLQTIGRSQSPGILGTSIFPLEHTKLYSKTKGVQYGSRTEGT